MDDQIEQFNKRFKVGDLVQHFKRELLPPEQQGSSEYLYAIKALAYHTETGEPLVIYKALYENNRIYARPLSMFIGEVEKEKYPSVIQKYRFEKLKTNYEIPF